MMDRTVMLLLAFFALPGLVLAADSEKLKPKPEQIEFFESKIRPVLAANCLSCHGAEKQKMSLRLDSREAMLEGGESGPAIMPGEPDSSLLIAAIAYSGDDQMPMPPKGKLKDEEIQALRQWVEMGAIWPESASPKLKDSPAASKIDPRSHWSFRPVIDPPLPAIKDSSWPRSPIDRFVLDKLEANGMRPVGQADKRILIRRAAFDLTGLPPSPAEIDAFLNDESGEAFTKVVDRLLASPNYGERWGRHWLDVARYGEDQAHTFEARLYPQGYLYRDWVVKALNADMPYDRFITEQIAGDLIEGPGRESRLAALGFFALGPVYYGNAIADERDDRIDTLCRGVLALTVSCARCHDHKFDPIPTQDYYSLAGVFASTEYKEYPAAPKAVVEAFNRAAGTLKKKTTEVDAFSFLATSSNYLVYPSAKNQPDRNVRPVLKPKVKELRAELDRLKKTLPPPYPVYHALADSATVKNIKVAIRGNAENPGEEAPRRFLSILSVGTPAPYEKGSGRLELARSIVRKDNPLTSRVIVNRIWEHHFGRGLVATSSNFGTLGETPTHPELLDYLAARFVSEEWSLKSLHRAILLTSTYQLASTSDSHNAEIDPENHLLWRMNRRRLEVEAWRDAMLAVSGELDPSLEGPSKPLVNSENRRRTLYAAISRHNLDGLLRLFDFPDPNITCDRRAETSVPLQQLFVLNSDFMIKQAIALAKRLDHESSEPDAERIRRAFVLVYGRTASEEEVRWGSEFVGSNGSEKLSKWEQYAQVLLGSNEFAFVD